MADTTLAILTENLDQFFLLIMGMCVLFMQCGFAFLEAGAVRSKNVTNILIKNVSDSFVAGISYWLFGYAFAFGEGNTFIGHSFFASEGMPETDYAQFFFQYTFAATAATIVSGAVAERCEFIAYFVYSFVITAFMYPVVTHWTWGMGFLGTGVEYDGIGTIAYQDFAGSGIVHVLGGVAAFVGAAILGPRLGRFHKESKTSMLIRGHSVPIMALGGFILFFGFLAFNGGSQLAISGEGDGTEVAIAIVNTVISASFAAFTALIINKIPLFGNNSWSLLITINGALTGMVAACAGCNNYYPWGSAIVGTVAGIMFHSISYAVRALKVDDPLDAVAVHFGGGTWGVIALAFLHNEDGIILNWDKQSGLILVWQLAGWTTITVWAAVTSTLLFGSLRLLKIFRVSEDIELRGLDIPKHNEPAYPVEAYGHGHIEKILQVLDKAHPMKVIQAFEQLDKFTKGENGGIDNGGLELRDNGPYEHPEVNHTQLRMQNMSNDPVRVVPKAYPVVQKAYPVLPQAHPAVPQAYPVVQKAFPVAQKAYPAVAPKVYSVAPRSVPAGTGRDDSRWTWECVSDVGQTSSPRKSYPSSSDSGNWSKGSHYISADQQRMSYR